MDSPPPPTPSPPPRLRRSPKRPALHERSDSHANEVTFPTIRPVTDADAKVYATSPFPTSERQFLAPWGPRPYPFVAGRGLGGSPNSTVSQSNATSLATPRVQNPREHAPRAINAKHAPSPAQFSHDGPGLEPFAAHTHHPPSSPPVEVTEKSHDSPWSGIDVDRLVMDRGLNPNDDHHERPALHLMPVAPATQPRSHGYLHPSSSPSFVTPLRYPSSISNSNSSRASRANLGAIASVASGLSYDSQEATPMSVGSVGSSGTVIRRRGFTGPTPPGFYTLFPPTPRPLSGHARYARSSSAPPRPDSLEFSSPVSPLSPEDDIEHADFPRRLNPAHVHSSSETALGGTPASLDYKGQQGAQFVSNELLSPTRIQPDQPSTRSPSFQIPRKPVVGRSNAVRWTSYMSTIPSEPTDERSSTGEQVSRIHSGATASSSLGAGFSGQNHPSLKTIGNSRLSRDFPLPEPLFSGKRVPRHRVTSGDSTIRIVSTQDGDLQPAPNDRVASLSSVYSHPDYHDSGSQTEAAVRRNNRGSLFRESIPAWARYSLNFISRSLSHSGGQSLSFDSLQSKSNNNSNQSQSQFICAVCAGLRRLEHEQPLQFPNDANSLANTQINDANTDAAQRFYYSNEARNRQTIGQRLSGLSQAGIPQGGGPRRHTVDSQYPYQDSLRIARNRPTQPVAVTREDSYRDSMPITPVVDPDSIFVGEEIRGETRNLSGNNWSPHLWHNRNAAVKRRTMFQAPSIDEEAEGRGLSRRNAQIWLFAVGFVFPLGECRPEMASPSFYHVLILNQQPGSSLPSSLYRPCLELLQHRRRLSMTLRRRLGRLIRRGTRMRDGGGTSTASCLS